MLLVPDRASAESFLERAISALRTLGIAAEIVEQTPDVAVPGPIDLRAIGVLIDVHGDLSGLTWQFPLAVTQHAANVMAPELALDPGILEATASELANMLTGRGLDALADHGIQVDLALPRITDSSEAGVTGQLATTHGVIVVIFHRATPE